MSTDDLTKALWIAGPLRGFADPSARERALVVLADEVDRLREERDGWQTLRNEWRQTARDLAAERDAARAEADRFRTLWDRHGKNDLLAERDAARAALERVTELLTLWARLASQQANLGDVVHDLTRALEGA